MKKTFDTEKKLYTLSLLVQDIPGVLSQVARLFSRKGYNIESIVSGETSQPGLTRITIVILGDELMVNQIAAQCRKLIPVQVVKILDEETSIQREFAMIKVMAVDRTTRDEIIQMANIFRANIIDVSRERAGPQLHLRRQQAPGGVQLRQERAVTEAGGREGCPCKMPVGAAISRPQDSAILFGRIISAPARRAFSQRESQFTNLKS